MQSRLHRWNTSDATALSRKVTEAPVVVFDVDGTLAVSRKPVSRSIAKSLCALLSGGKWLAIVGGGSLSRIQAQVVQHLPCRHLEHLVLCPLSGAELYVFRGNHPHAMYRHTLTRAEVRTIQRAFHKTMEVCGHTPQQVWGPLIENRGSQVTFSALGQDAPLAAKRRWNERNDLRPCLVQALRTLLKRRYEIRMGGLTSIDITVRGIDKAYALHRLSKVTGVPVSRMVYVGDALYPQGNDAPVLRTRATSVWVSSPRETLLLLRGTLALLAPQPQRQRHHKRNPR
ncbi:MAG: haloacid dehalogenase [Candidatus Parcubacteria bacterium]|nr:MAG: haloacid dehalogenase [Candidatus Parcubacteria bacterium]